MGDLLIRNVPKTTLDRLKAAAKRHHRSVQAEALEALERAALPVGTALVEWLKTVRVPGASAEAGIKAIREARDER